MFSVVLKTVKRERKDKLKDREHIEEYKAILEGSVDGVEVRITLKSEDVEELNRIAGNLGSERLVKITTANATLEVD